MKKRLAGMLLLALTVLFLCAQVTHADFVQSGASTMYQAADGTYIKGLQKINGVLYYFNQAGVLQKGGWVTAADGKEYYASQNGALLVSQWVDKVYYVKENAEKAKGITTINSLLFYFSSSTGKLQKGKLKDEQGNMYITNDKGVVFKGQFFRYKKKSYYAHEDGKLALGLTKVANDYYFFRKNNGKMVTNARRKVDGNVYFFSSSGKAVRDNWVKIGGKYYYFESDGRMARNKLIGTNWYVDENGERKKASEAPKTGVNKSGGKNYLYDSNGKLLKSQWVKLDGKTYYAGSDGAALTGMQTIDSKKYYFNDDGVLQTDTVVVSDGVAYSVAADGQVTGKSNNVGAAMAAYGQKFVGNPYVWGGTDLVNGADCSGFCYAIHQKFGIQLMRVADDQMKGPSEAYQKLGYKKGTVISDKNLLPGDLVFYGTASYASHVAMYIGNNKVVHAANSRLGIIISDMDYVNSRVKNHGMRYWA